MPTQDLLRKALDARDYTRSVMFVGAGNRTSSSAAASACVADMRDAYERRGVRGRLPVLGQLRTIAADAKVTGCGNCGEHAAVAFVYLLDRGVRPIEYAWLADGDHAFVVIGRREGDPRSGLVVDAYYGRVYGMHRWTGGRIAFVRFE